MALVRLRQCALASEPAIPAYICDEYQNLMTMFIFLSVHSRFMLQNIRLKFITRFKNSRIILPAMALQHRYMLVEKR